MSVALPSTSTHRIDDRTTRWLTVQSSDGSTLMVRLWQSENRQNAAKCEQEARALRPLPRREGLEVLESRTVETRELTIRADVGVLASEDGAVFGSILAFGGNGRRCFAYVYVTRAAPSSEVDPRAAVGDRLAWMTENSLTTLRFESDLDLRLERDAAASAAVSSP